MTRTTGGRRIRDTTLPADFEPYSVDEVHRFRNEPAGDVAAERAKLVEEINQRNR